jgi:hypothetical protein
MPSNGAILPSPYHCMGNRVTLFNFCGNSISGHINFSSPSEPSTWLSSSLLICFAASYIIFILYCRLSSLIAVKSLHVSDLKELVGAYITGQLTLLYPLEDHQTHPNPSENSIWLSSLVCVTAYSQFIIPNDRPITAKWVLISDLRAFLAPSSYHSSSRFLLLVTFGLSHSLKLSHAGFVMFISSTPP